MVKSLCDNDHVYREANKGEIEEKRREVLKSGRGDG